MGNTTTKYPAYEIFVGIFGSTFYTKTEKLNLW